MVRVTQSMLSTNMLRNLNSSYAKMSNYQDMMTTGRKFVRPSDDPVAAVKGMNYRVQLDKIGQFQRNVNDAEGWLDTTDASLDQVGTTLNRIKELIVQAANDTNTADERAKIKVELDQIREQIKDVANTQLGEQFIFSGTHTQKPLYTKVQVVDVQAYYNSLPAAEKETFFNDLVATPPNTAAIQTKIDALDINADSKVFKDVRVLNTIKNPAPTTATGFPDMESEVFTLTDPNDPTKKVAVGPFTLKVADTGIKPEITVAGQKGKVEMEVFNGIQLTVNSDFGPELFEQIDDVLTKVSNILANPNAKSKEIGDKLGGMATNLNTTIADVQARVLDARADVGARMNRVELMMNRLEVQEINVTKQKSLNEDTDYAETITHMATQESIHQAALSVGAKIIQQTLVDFIR